MPSTATVVTGVDRILPPPGSARRSAQRLGLALYESRLRGDPHIDDLGGWRIVDAHRNWIVAGANFDLDLDDVESWLDDLA